MIEILCALLCAVGDTNDPPQVWNWRGPNRDGHSPDTGLLKQWPQGGPPLAWKATGLGSGFSSVSLWRDRLFTTGETEESCSIVCLGAADGKALWTVPMGPAGKKVDHPGARCTPATDGKVVIALSPLGDLLCVDPETGKERWRKNLKEDFGGRVGGWAYSESPLLDGDRVVLTPGGKNGTVLALRADNGQTVWQSKEFTEGAQYTSLLPAEIGGVRQYIALTMDSVAGIAAADGKLLWRATRRGRTAVCTTPVQRDGFVFVTSSYSVGCSAFKISAADGKFSAEEGYVGRFMANHHGGVIIVGDHLYGYDDGVSEQDKETKKSTVLSKSGLKCLDLKSGKEVWSDRSVGKGSIAYADGHFVVRSEGGRGTIALVEATPTGYKEMGRFDQPDRSRLNSWPHPVIFGGRMYIRDQDVLLCYDVKAK